MDTRVLLADDHQLMRQGLRSLVVKTDGLKVVGEATNGRAAVEKVKELSPNVVIMDVSMPDLNGIEATRQISDIASNTKVIGLSMHSDRQYVGKMLEEGAHGYLLKECAFEELETAIKTVMGGRTYLSPEIADVVIENYVRGMPAKDPSAFTQLTPREREVLQLLVEGKSTRKAANTLGISVKTIETHRRNIMQKLDIHNIAELTKYAIQEGITSIDT